jgi:hypothetical protein
MAATSWEIKGSQSHFAVGFGSGFCSVCAFGFYHTLFAVLNTTGWCKGARLRRGLAAPHELKEMRNSVSP